MKLKSVEITEFQSIRSSNEFQIADITCLVGKNEAGKTAVLQALYRLNPLISKEGEYDVTDDYPRADVEDYRQAVERKEREPAPVVRATFRLNDQELQALAEEFGPDLLRRPELTLTKGYENELYFELPIDESVVVKAFINRAQLPSRLTTELANLETVELLESILSAKETEQNREHVRRLKDSIDHLKQAGGLSEYVYEKYLAAHVPKFLYFDEYYVMRGQENIEALKRRKASNELKRSDYPLLGLLELARLDLDQLSQLDRTETLINKLEGASNHLSKKVLRYWSQNKHLQMVFDVRPARPGDPQEMQEGTNLWARIKDTKHSVTTPLGTRSRGFVWFFSFLAWFDQLKKQEPLILLLDEPGLFLHGKAQGDFLRYIEEELGENHQVIYTTHSPFMVDPLHFERVRIVQDKSMDEDKPTSPDMEGTKVLSDVLEATDDSLFPLQGALGYEIHQTLFVGPNNLVVEGVSDLLYLQSISGILSSRGRTGLDPRWTITPVGGTGKVPTYVALLGSQKGLTVATLLDIQRKDRQIVENLYRKNLLKKKNVFTYSDFLSTDEADIEDMFEESFYIWLVNAEYASELKKPIAVGAVTSRSPRMVLRLQDYFAEHPLKNGAQFSHYRPARYFAERTLEIQKDVSSETLNRFENMFESLNALL